MTYSVKEIFYTLQGEGAQAGRPAVFCRFAGCNLWSGLERDRAQAACQFCDTDFVGTDGPGGGKFASADGLALAIASHWPSTDTVSSGFRYVVCTGGEPLLQLDTPLINALHRHGFTIAVETNGTLPVPIGVDWVCVSPKGMNPLQQSSGHELKLVYPQPVVDPAHFESLKFDHFFLQPMDGPTVQANTLAAIGYCKAHPKWKLSIQSHKILNIP